ncbi:MAG: TlpA disulfide reductase family protein [Petrimonas sp.]|uniref:TlpA family protein disulfide reductase n=1 Tax=Petrimonas sp. TaxID=2023866 RepID=UPI002B3B0442|nr:TlpA disulfide reductase family protein [Petrimonas sp.]
MLLSCNSSVKKQDTVQVQNTDDRQYLVKVGDQAPDFEMSFPDGKKVKLSDLHGKVVMLQFTASWCGVCRKEMPHIEKDIWQKHKENPQFVLYGIDREEPAEKIQVLRDATGVTYPIGMDPDANIFGLYAEKDAGITRNIIIDRSGKIVMLTRLYEEKEFNEMVSLIDKMLSSES